MTRALKVELKKTMGDLGREIDRLRSAIREAERLGKESIVFVLQQNLSDLEREYREAHKLWNKVNSDPSNRQSKYESGYDPSPKGYIKAPKFFGDLLDVEEKAYLFRDKQLEAQNDSSTTDDLKKDVTKMKKEVKVLEDAAKEIDDIRKT